MTSIESASMYVGGVYAPVPDEIDSVDLEVTGSIPPELDGRYLRNGPNPLPGDRAGHWFAGRGMVHGVRLSGGRARWYRNRWVDTNADAGHPIVGPDDRDLRQNLANTHVIEHGGTLLALCEGGLPYEVTGELDTVGAYDFAGRLRTAMTAHPKTDPVTGELFFYGYSVTEPYITFHIADAAGNLHMSIPINVPRPTMMHDFAITEHYVVWLDLPVVFDGRPGRSMPFSWSEDYPARIGIMPRYGGPVRWIEVDPCYVFHVGNAREDPQDRVLLDAVRYTPEIFQHLWHGPIRQNGGQQPVTRGHGALLADPGQGGALHRWLIDPDARSVNEVQLDDHEIEFPSLNDDHVGRASRYLYAVSGSQSGGVVKYDTDRDRATAYRFGCPSHVGEAVFVPADHAADEDEGWLINITTPIKGGPSSLVIIDATDISAGPIGSVTLPRRVPAGFHGSWIPETTTEHQ